MSSLECHLVVNLLGCGGGNIFVYKLPNLYYISNESLASTIGKNLQVRSSKYRYIL